ncbi:MAG: prepilin-type N-terminal cleavage/methylation domain-containing protein [Candidatus Omnitrophica bacterium]|nr:prepilin-type N-terminal cleavage/methylation domain-containing protein [Candidatus Omnitrophota bacterium]
MGKIYVDEMRLMKNDRRGFTLLEVAIVLAIMSMASTIVAPAVGKIRESARTGVCLADRAAFQRAEDTFILNTGSNSSSFTELFTSGYMRKSPACQSGGSWQWDPAREKILCTLHDSLSSTVSGPTVVSALDAVLVGRWFRLANSIATNWSNQTARFKIKFDTTGDYEVSLSAKNRAGWPGWTKVDGYNFFKIKVLLDGRNAGALLIPASDTEFQTGKIKIKEVSAGTHTLSFQWTNDAYKPSRQQDSNIEIDQISFERIG